MDPSYDVQDDLAMYTTDLLTDITMEDLPLPSAPLSLPATTAATTVPSSLPDASQSASLDDVKMKFEPAENNNESILAGTAAPYDDDNDDDDEQGKLGKKPSNCLTFDKDEFSFLPQVHTIVQRILTGDNSDDIGKAVVRLNEQIAQARRLLQDLPGLQYVKEEQEAILQHETALLQEKKEQLAKYARLAAFTGVDNDNV